MVSVNSARTGVCEIVFSSVIRLISGLNSSIERTLGLLRKTLPQQHEKNGVPVRTGLVSTPSSASVIALNGSPGYLQFFNVDKMCLSQEVKKCFSSLSNCSVTAGGCGVKCCFPL